jgi:hypothetical protein
MTRYTFAFILTLCYAISISTVVNAQTPSNKPLPQDKKKQTPAKSAAPKEPDELADAQRAFAIEIIYSLADEARSYKDEPLRASVQARAADILWNVDQERARTLFNRAWEAAEVIDKEGQRRNEEERRRFLSGRGGTGFIPMPPNLRAEVLRFASRHDRALAESFLAKMEEENKRAEEESSTARYWDPTEPPEATAKRLELALQLLESDETERALLIATPGLNRVTSQGIMFLVLLRKKNAALADQRFASLLEWAATDPMADATSVSLLSSYIFTPSVLVTATRSGLRMNPWSETLPPLELPSALRAMFFRVATQILLRPVPPSELERTSAGRAGTYFTIMRLLPLFEQHDREMATALQTRLNTLAQGTEGIIPKHQRAFVNAGFTQKETKEEGFDDILAAIERASSTNERDHLYALAVRAAVMTNDSRAREFVGEIEDAELKKHVRNFVDFILVNKALEKKDAEKALQLAREGELSYFQRVWAYTEIAQLLKTSAPEQAREVINEAITESGRIAASSTESPQAWVAITNRMMEIDRARTFETVLGAIKAVNKVPDYTGEENKVSVRFQSKNDIAMVDIAAPSISLAGLFSALGKEDIYLATDTARNIIYESPRAVALLAAARSIFERKPLRNKRKPLRNSGQVPSSEREWGDVSNGQRALLLPNLLQVRFLL